MYLIRCLSVKKDLNTLLATKILKKLEFYVYFAQKWLHREKNLWKFEIKDDELLSKVKSYSEKISANFHNNEIPKEGSQYTYESMILIDSFFRAGKNYLEFYFKSF